ncbi:putative type-1 restriction enzyme specificity protein MG438 [Streptococcus oralis]|uniref:Putative type-1 restriction enzyme specificity protein MG438 n=1 Tax=Streptococcus oralis TaxID=1303 RepID=A0A428G602_STROR|nr:restriction endonuclease subunit S [Streptococcus oralis]RSJ70186.1 putative type-1 restriction enzyme specificity protein MG438 [Streptococcus oralis]
MIEEQPLNRKKNIPQIRFQNYEDGWDVEKLKNIFGTIRNAFVGTATPYYVEKGKFYLESNNVKNGKINYISQIFINDEFYEKQRDKWLKTNDIVMVQSGHVGHTAVIPEELNNTAAHALIVFTDYKKEVNPHFLNYQFQSNDKRKELDLISTGNTIKHILASEMKNFKMDFPTVDEQSAIGSLFRTLDDLLASYKDNLTNYQALKATMLSKMFPKAGQTVPEIRLDGFEGEWERKNLSEGCNINSGRDYKHLKDGDIPVYGTGGYMLSVNDKLSDEDAIGIGRKGTIDKPYLLSAPFWTVDTLFYVTCKVGYDLYYLFLIFQKVRWKKFDESTGVPSLSKKTIEKVVSKFPSLPEQQAIGSYFSNLDNLINSHQEKISQLETLKKKLLQDMFI